MDLPFRFHHQSQYSRDGDDEVCASNCLLHRRILVPYEHVLGLKYLRQGRKEEDFDPLEETAGEFVVELTGACLMEVEGWLEVSVDDWGAEDEEGRLEALRCCPPLA